MYQKDREGADKGLAGPTRICPRHEPGHARRRVKTQVFTLQAGWDDGRSPRCDAARTMTSSRGETSSPASQRTALQAIMQSNSILPPLPFIIPSPFIGACQDFFAGFHVSFPAIADLPGTFPAAVAIGVHGRVRSCLSPRPHAQGSSTPGHNAASLFSATRSHEWRWRPGGRR